ncbi:hypothetical protein MSAR_35490 [Mycolicibacterium sarraceniae]|uniref:Uncharacterized protein n=1 Tax=Mycolicibacterium sarraceniae TaxID=1534348 RepID=A0A7I7SUN8_9MYCO|nr:hypothetical protein MSAR_35490 [Mycolicibacterium sarraceniae]
MGIGVPAEPGQVSDSGRFDQTESAHARNAWALRRWFSHVHDGSATSIRRSLRFLPTGT